MQKYFLLKVKTHRANNQPFEAAQSALEITKQELYRNKSEKALLYLREAKVLNQTATNSKL
jgi:hypothetical protein